ncbi:MAG: hypothetical protein QG599_745 [Pseudomonadota bacterium]|nr:hypothetical protein [Pseudomonadota bacterium]
MKNVILAIIYLFLGLNPIIGYSQDYSEYIVNYRNQLENGNLDEALDNLNKAILVHPKSFYPYYLRAKILLIKEDFDKATNDANKSLEINPENEYVHELLTLINNQRKEKEKKEKGKLLLQAYLSWSKGDLKTAQVEINSAIEYNPEILKFPLYHLKKPTFLNIGDTRRLVPDQETLLVNETDGKILYPYYDVTVDPANLTEGKRVDVTGECPQKGTLCSLNLKVTADLDLEHALLWGDKLPPQSTQIQLEPALSKVYTFTAEIPVDMAAQSFDLILISRKGQSFKRVLQLQGTQLQITAPKDLSNEL